MTITKQIELNDGLIYLYIAGAGLNILFTAILIVLITTKWKSASSAVNPTQYRLRNFYVGSLLIAFIGCLLHSIIVVFGINDLIIDWNYDKLSDTFEQLLALLASFGQNTFWSFIFIAYIFRMKIIYIFNKFQNYLLNGLIFILFIYIFIVSIGMLEGGLELGYQHDNSSGIIIIRPNEQIAYYVFVYLYIPLMFIISIIFTLSYYITLKQLFNNKLKRKQLLNIVIKEMLLVGISVMFLILFGIIMVIGIHKENALLLVTSINFIVLICTFLMLNFNTKYFYGLCYFCSLFCLKCCCLYAEGDDVLLKTPLTNPQQYDTVNQQEQESEVDDL